MTKHVKNHIKHSVKNIIYLSDVSSSHSSQNEDEKIENAENSHNGEDHADHAEGTIKTDDILKNIKDSIISKPKHIKKNMSLRKGVKLLSKIYHVKLAKDLTQKEAV